MRYRLSQEVAIVDSKIGAAVDNTTLATDLISMALHKKVAFWVTVKDASADTTIDAKVQSDVAGGSTFNDITGLAITQFTAGASEKEFVIEVDADELNAGDTHCRLLVTAGNGTAGAAIGIIAIGTSRYLPAGQHDLGTVQEIKFL